MLTPPFWLLRYSPPLNNSSFNLFFSMAELYERQERDLSISLKQKILKVKTTTFMVFVIDLLVILLILLSLKNTSSTGNASLAF